MKNKELLIVSNIFTIIVFIITILFLNLKINDISKIAQETNTVNIVITEDRDICYGMVESLNHYLDKIETKGKL